MSLINKMLTDLEARQHPSPGMGPPSHVYHDLHPAAGRGRCLRGVVFLVLVLVSLAATGVVAWSRWAPEGWREQGVAWSDAVYKQAALVLGVSAGGDSLAHTDDIVRPTAETVPPEQAPSQIAATAARPASALRPAVELAEAATNSDSLAGPAKVEPAKVKTKPKASAGTQNRTPTKTASRAPRAYSQEPRQRRATPAKPEPAPTATLSKTATPAPALAQMPQSPRMTTAQEAVVEKTLRAPTPEERAENAYREGAQHLAQSRLADAEEALRQALASDPRHIKARELLVGLVVRKGRLDEAQQLLKEGRTLFPEDYQFAQLLARLHVQRGADAEGLALLEQVQNAAQKDADFLGLLAALYQRADRHIDAIKAYSRALILKPEQGQWWLALGISFEAENSPGAAYNAYLRAIAGRELDPTLARYAQQRLALLRPKVATPAPSKMPASTQGEESQAAN